MGLPECDTDVKAATPRETEIFKYFSTQPLMPRVFFSEMYQCWCLFYSSKTHADSIWKARDELHAREILTQQLAAGDVQFAPYSETFKLNV